VTSFYYLNFYILLKLLLLMKMLLLYTIKAILTNPQLLGWGILFDLFWGVMGAYVIAPHVFSDVPPSEKPTAYLQYTSIWYADLVIMSLSAIAVSITMMLYYQTGTLPYLIRYSKLKTSTYFISMYSGSLIASLILELLITITTVLMFSNSIGVAVTPSSIGIIMLTIILGSIFFISFSTFLNLIVIEFHAYRLQNFFNFLPLMLGFLAYAVFTFVVITSSAVYYSYPFLTIPTLLYYGYFGSFKFENVAGNEITLNLSLPLLSLSIIAWIVVLNVINYILVRKMYYVSLEEGRIM